MACLISFLYIFAIHSLKCLDALSSIPTGRRSMNINMPDVAPHVHDSYICTAKKLNTAESYIIQYEPDADGTKAHHMLLFGCSGLQRQTKLYPGYWKCGGELCSGMTIIYGWAKNAPSMKLPPNVGHLVGGNSSIQYLVLQLHYATAFPKGVTDNSGLKLHMTTERQPYITGIYLLMAQRAIIPPYRPKYYIDVNCKFQGTVPIHVFAYRVHTHRLGSVVSGYKFSVQNNSWSFLAKGNPQWPQAFYPMEQPQIVTDNDILASRCTYNSSESSLPTYIGSTSNDEMCNLYLMYYTEYRNTYSEQIPPCVGVEFDGLSDELPPGNDQPLPRNLILEQQAHVSHGHGSAITYDSVQPGITSKSHFGSTNPHFADWNHVGQMTGNNVLHSKRILNDLPDVSESSSSYPKYNVVAKWPSPNFHFGQISAVTIDNNGNVVIFHRGSHVWNDLTFDYFNNYLLASDGPISVPTIVTIDSVSGLHLRSWGRNLFYMPHGLSIDTHDRYWLTDVALHQIFCFSNGGEKPLLVLGEKFVPGSDRKHFCKPTSVAVNKNGDIFVADGYCNARVMKFSATGIYLNEWGKGSNVFDKHPPVGTFNLPHKIVLLEDRNMFCVADRENGRIQCFLSNGDFHFEIQREEFGGSLFSVAYAKNKGLLFAICGRTVKDHPVKAFVFNVTNQQLLTVFSPKSGTFTMPHDIAVSSDGEESYVCEIGPNIVWKFIREYHKSMKKVLNAETLPPPPSIHHEPTHIAPWQESHGYDHELSSDAVDEETKNFETSIVIMALLGIPILLLILITVIIRLRKRGRLQGVTFGHLKGWMGGYKTPHPQEKFNLGHFLNPHKGFDKVAIVESDGDEDGDGSDVEEFCVTAKNA